MCSEAVIQISHVTSSSPRTFDSARPAPGSRPSTSADSGAASRPTTSISTRSPSAASMRPRRVPSWPMPLYDLVASLPLKIEGYTLEGLARMVSSGFERKSTIFVLRGAGQEGRGEDVTYEAPAHDAQQAAGPVLELAGEWTFDSFSEHLGTLDTFPGYTPEQPVYRSYRRWGFESAALALALRQAGTSLHELLGRTAEPVTFVVSSRMGTPPTIAPVARRLAV